MKKYIKWIILGICLFVFVLITINVLNDNNMASDVVMYDWISKYIISDGMTSIIKCITWFGSTIGIIIIGLISLFIIRNKKINISLAICLILGTIVNNIIKIVFARARPNINPLVVEDSYSFPSGHSMMSVLLYGYLIYLIYNYIKNKKIKYLLITLLSILILSIGFTRVYLGVHYFSDVIGGFVFGIAYLIMYIEISKRVIKNI